MPRTEFGVAIASVLVVAGVLAIPLVSPPVTAQSIVVKHPLSTSTATPSASGVVGAGCAAYEKQVPSGAGSVVGMSQSPVAVAASNNPILKSLTAAVSGKLNPKVNLVTKLDNGHYTVFAPVDSAFAKLPPATLASLKVPGNASQLSSILEYHVLTDELLPSSIDGTHATLAGGTVTVKGSGNDITVNGATVICGGIQTLNATVYLIDTVLTPPKK